MFAMKGNDLIDSDFCGLFEEPFHPVDVFRRSDGENDTLTPMIWDGLRREDVASDVFGIIINDYRFIACSFAVNDVDCVADTMPKNAYAMTGFCFRQSPVILKVGSVKLYHKSSRRLFDVTIDVSAGIVPGFFSDFSCRDVVHTVLRRLEDEEEKDADNERVSGKNEP